MNIPADAEALFDEIIGNAIQERADKEARQRAERDAEDQKYRDAMAPIRDAFEAIIRTRKPSTLDREPLKLRDEDFYSSRSIVAFSLISYCTSYYILVEWKPESSYRVMRNKGDGLSTMNGDILEEFFDDWREAYRRALEHLAPHIAYCEGRTADNER